MRLIRGLVLALTLVAASLAGAARLAAQTAEIAALEPIRQAINQIEGAVRRGGLSVSALVDYSQRINPLRDDLHNRIDALEPRLAQVDERVKQLGPPPPANALPEAVTLANERQRLTEAHGEIDAALKQARLLLARADQVAGAINDQRRSAYTRELLEQSGSALSPFFWTDAALAVPGELTGLRELLRNWWAQVAAGGGWLKLVTAVLLGSLMAGCIFAVMRWWQLRSQSGRPVSRLAKAMAGLGVFARIALTTPLTLIVLLQTVESFGLRTQGWDEITSACVIAVVLAAFGRGVAVGVLAPGDPARRLVGIDDQTAPLLATHLIWGARLLGLMVFLLLLHKAAGAAHALLVATNMLLALSVAGLLLHLLLGSHGTVLNAEEAPRNLWVRAVAWLVAVGIAIALALGYASLAAFFAERTVVTVAVCGALYLAFVAADALFTEALAADTPRGRAIAGHLGLQSRKIGLIGTVLSGVSFLTFVFVGIVLIIGPWEVTASDFLEGIKSIAFGVRIGDINISLGAIMSALLLLLVILFATRLVQRWLEARLLPHTDLEPSLRQSITAICGYVGVITGIVVTMAQIGIDPQKIALVAGALSVGIGFGLQSIVSNFVSGLILLSERPIRVGDLISVKGDEGRVRRISVRATEIETGERSSVIIPNSELITGIVKNRTRGDDTALSKITLLVAFGTDSDQVREILLACAREHPQVLKRPEPAVLLTHFAESGLSFELAVVCADVNASGAVTSDLRFAILRRFRDAGIRIPYPQRELRWHEPSAKPKAKRSPSRKR